MYAVEFEADIKDGVVQVPDKYPKLQGVHARVVILVDEEDESVQQLSKKRIDFSQYKVGCFKDIDPVEYQRKMRNEW